MTEHSKNCDCVECRRYRGESPNTASEKPRFEISCKNAMCRYVEKADTEFEAQEKADIHHEQTGHITQRKEISK